MKFYIATRLERADDHRIAREVLEAAGHQITYDWTVHGSVKDEGVSRIREVAMAELGGVRDADFVVVLLPGGRGTHAELGAATVLGKPVYLIARPGSRVLDTGAETSAFYHAVGVLRLYEAGLGLAALLIADHVSERRAWPENPRAGVPDIPEYRGGHR